MALDKAYAMARALAYLNPNAWRAPLADTPQDEGFSPPYLSFETFRNFVSRLGEKAIPPRVDRSMMIGIAGGTQTYLLSALRDFRLVGDANEVTPTLVEMATDERALVSGMRELVIKFYGDQVRLANEKATAAQLEESFRDFGYTGSTLRKAVTFFIHMARFAELPLSPHFRAPIQRGGLAPRQKSTARAKPPVRRPTGNLSTASGGAPSGESHTIELKSGGTITLSCSAAFLSLSKEDRDFVFDLVDRLQDYSRSSTLPTRADATASHGDSS